ncbi:MAG: hypothetical protein RIR90_302 [Bacteroidota bacterium]|jgi:exosortase/archaeosortase family protein
MNLASFKHHKQPQRFLLIFLTVFSFLAGGTYLFIGLIEPSGRFYVPWLAANADFINPYIHLIIAVAKWMLEILGYIADNKSHNQLQINNYNTVVLAYQCVGIGIISLWVAFVSADTISIMLKAKWILIGIFVITIINAARIAILLIAHYENWSFLTGVSHHDFYNYVVYTLFILLILIYTKYAKA